jgi:HAD superfamily phosphoserine phosphatase-like hydrolase
VIELAIYDMDRTITRRATFTPFLIYAARMIAPWRLALLPLSALAMLAYAVRLIDRKRLKEVNHGLLLGKVHGAALTPVISGFATRTVARNLMPGALPAIAADRAAGRRLVLATASYRFYVAPIAARLGFDDVVATNAIVGLDARIVPKIDGDNNYGPAKLRMIEGWMAMEGIARSDAHIRFYSDHPSDAPVLEWADVAFAVNASPRMRRLARRRGWALLDWS